MMKPYECYFISSSLYINYNLERELAKFREHWLYCGGVIDNNNGIYKYYGDDTVVAAFQLTFVNDHIQMIFEDKVYP